MNAILNNLRILLLVPGLLLVCSCSSKQEVIKSDSNDTKSEQSADNRSPAEHATEWNKLNHSGFEALKSGDLTKAETDFVAALKEAEACGSNDSRIAVTLTNLTSVYENRKMYGQCLSYLKKARSIFSKVYGENSGPVLVTLKDEARILCEGDQYPAALAVYTNAIKRMEAAHDKELGPTLAEYAVALRHEKKDGEAAKIEGKIKTLPPVKSS